MQILATLVTEEGHGPYLSPPPPTPQDKGTNSFFKKKEK